MSALVSGHPLIQHKLHLLRSRVSEPKKFRELVRELGVLLAYEATADLALEPISIETPLAAMEARQLAERVGLVPILRAGLGMVEGVWEVLPMAEVWHIGLYRDEQTL
ncbi:MAG TPA: uracil phosphoribosyltransferase, partial [Chloroflexota bacterium]